MAIAIRNLTASAKYSRICRVTDFLDDSYRAG